MALFKLQPTVREAEHPVAFPGFTRGLEFRHVGFSYGDGPVLDNISFTLRRGQRLGLAGESGSGKSSLINLVFRFYDPHRPGKSSLIDGAPPPQLRRPRSPLPARTRQPGHPPLQRYRGGKHRLRQNRRHARGDHRRRQGSPRARLHRGSPFRKASDTPLGERGQRLSGGQRQRIAIARAFVRNAPILVLDEATASLDSQAEAEVQKAIDHLAENRTVICVAHRLSTLRSMDHILVLEKGRIVEQGGFDQLLAQRGLFTAMAARAKAFFPQAA